MKAYVEYYSGHTVRLVLIIFHNFANPMNVKNSSPTVTDDNDVIKRIIEWIQTEKKMIKSAIIKKLRWGRGFKSTPYRRTLLRHPDIHEIKQQISIYQWID